MRLALAVVFLASVGAVLAIPDGSSRASPGGYGRIVFSSTRDSSAARLFTVAGEDGSALAPLTTGDLGDYSPRWSPDGNRLVFQREGPDHARDIFIVNADGTGEMNITDSPGVYDNQPAWSPEGTRIALATASDNPAIDISVWDGATGQITRLTDTGFNSQPDWSPDGTKIAYARYMGDPGNEIFVMNSDGSGQAQLTFFGGNSEQPRWSPDGSRIAFVSDKDGDFAVFSMKADGTDIVRHSDTDAYHLLGGWSPDGNLITFSDYRFGIGVLSTSQVNQSFVPGTAASDRTPDWQRVETDSLGDPNCSGFVEQHDALAAALGAARITPFPRCIAWANVNCDLALDGVDIVMILRHVAHLADIEPCGNSIPPTPFATTTP